MRRPPLPLILLLALLVPGEARVALFTETGKDCLGIELRRTVLGPFEISEYFPGGPLMLSVKVQGDEVLEDDAGYSLTMSAPLAGVPEKGCTGLSLLLDLGGSSGLKNGYLLADCCGEASIQRIDYIYGLSFKDSDGDGFAEALAEDAGFMDFGLEAAADPFGTGGGHLDRFDSPHLQRVLAYTPGRGWQSAKPGRFPALHRELMEKCAARARTAREKGSKDEAAALAMQAAYYALMAGEGRNEARDLLRELLPGRWRAELDQVFAAVLKKLQSPVPPMEAVLSKGSDPRQDGQ